MSTARDIINDALRKIHVIGEGFNASAEMADDALVTLNDMLAFLSVDGGQIYAETKETFNLTGGDGDYTIGSGGDFNTTRPLDILAMTVKEGTIDYSLIEYNLTQYSNISDKTIQGTPEVFYFDANYTLGTIYLYPVPTGGTVTIYSEKALTAFATLDTDYTFPPEYRSMLVYNLAEWIAPEYEREASPAVKRIANSTFLAIQKQNSKNNRRSSSFDVPTSENDSSDYNIYRGY